MGAIAVLASTSVFSAKAQQRPVQKVHREAFVPASDEVFSVVRQFYEFDADLPLDARMVEEWESETARFEKVVFTTSNSERVPLDLALPKDGKVPFPCVVLIHGLGNDRDRWWRDDRKALPEGLLEAGVAVASLDLRFHGERAAENDYQNPVYLTFGNNLEIRSRNMSIQSTIDSRRALSYLSGRSDIDEGRLAVAGYSLGGMIAIRLAALEMGLVAAVASAVPSTEQPQPTDPFDFAPRSSVPTLLQIGRTDWLSSPQDMRKLHGLFPVEDKALVFYEAGHRLPPQFAEDARAWLLERLVPTER